MEHITTSSPPGASASPTKTCTKCERSLPATPEYFSRSTKYGLQPKCKDCTKAYYRQNKQRHAATVKAWAQRNSEKRRQHARKFRDDHREEERERHRRFNREHPEQRSASRRRSYQRHAVARRAARRAYYVSTTDRARTYNREYKQAHPLVVREHRSRQRSRRHGGQTDFVIYEAILRRDGYVCHICKGAVLPEQLHFDHIIPLSKGGSHTEDNIAVAHSACNNRKNAKVAAETRKPAQ